MKIRTGLSLLAFTATLLGTASLTAQGIRQPAQFGPQNVQSLRTFVASHDLDRAAVQAPSIIATPPIRQSASVVKLKEIVSANNASTRFWLVGGTSKESMTAATAKVDALTGTTAVTATLSGLKPKTTYYFRLYASNAAGTTAGKILKVTTGERQSNAAETASATPEVLTASLTW